MDTEALNSDISVLKVCVLRQCMAIVNALRLIFAIAKSKPSVFIVMKEILQQILAPVEQVLREQHPSHQVHG